MARASPSFEELAVFKGPHDPGVVTARERGTESSASAIRRGGSEIRVGTASWTDPTMTAKGVFYPDDARTAEQRLRYYASRFPLVEVDSTYYALPVDRTAQLWADRTPDEFVFNIKAHALMTGHPTEVKRLPIVLQEMLPTNKADAQRVYASDLPDEVHDAVWGAFLDALLPLSSAGKLGAILLQYPRWFMPNNQSAEELRKARQRLGDVRGMVEFRAADWLMDKFRDRTFGLLRELGLAYVSVDEPQGYRSSVPPVAAVTSPDLAVFRFHGRRAETWEKHNEKVSERFRYLYDREQLKGWVPEIDKATAAAKDVHVLFNNCYGNYAAVNAGEMVGMLR